MGLPWSGASIGTPYGKRGSSWSCNANSSGGVHTGCDFPAPEGQRIAATIAGTIRHRSYGSAFGDHQFAISPSAGQPFEAGEVFFAHTRTRPSDGLEVQMGDVIAEVGSEGNVSGPHLHYEFHPTSKGVWSCSVHADPAPTLGGSAPPPSSGGDWTSGDVYQSKLYPGSDGDAGEGSDSVRRMQTVLNAWSFTGGQELPITGFYGPDTQHEVGLFQSQVCGDPPDGAIGPKQTDALFTKLGPWNIIR
jgi:hypothetical protein